jgi:hypothetical protein
MSNLTNNWDWSEIARASIKDGGLQLTAGPAAICLGFLCVLAWLIWRSKFSGKTFRHYEIVEAELNIANIGKVKLQPNDEIVRVAYQAWIELSTRKIGLAFDENHDVISEIYSSWYETFGRLRDLAKTIPARHIQTSEDTRNLVDLMIRVLNDGLRPHLTKWQAKFRRWYEAESKNDEHASLSPQEIQRLFPEYKALVGDLVTVQAQIVEYRDFLRVVAEGKTRYRNGVSSREVKPNS